jgi:hypothetical protein
MDRAVVAIATNYSLSDPIIHSVESFIQWQLQLPDSFMRSIRVNNLRFAMFLYTAVYSQPQNVARKRLAATAVALLVSRWSSSSPSQPARNGERSTVRPCCLMSFKESYSSMESNKPKPPPDSFNETQLLDISLDIYQIISERVLKSVLEVLEPFGHESDHSDVGQRFA